MRCIICESKLGNRNKHGYCQTHRSLSPVRKAQKARMNSNWWVKNNPGKSRTKMSEEERKKKARERMRERRSNNRETYRIKSNQWDKERRIKDSNYRIACNLRSRLSKALKGIVKRSSAINDLGCSLEDFRKYLESKFEPGMNWENYGHGIDKWNIDHIEPLSKADLSDINVQKRLSHYSNLKPMWHIDNLKKGNRYEY
jgi:hypothetical protein